MAEAVPAAVLLLAVHTTGAAHSPWLDQMVPLSHQDQPVHRRPESEKPADQVDRSHSICFQNLQRCSAAALREMSARCRDAAAPFIYVMLLRLSGRM